jgi:hypothetical protein
MRSNTDSSTRNNAGTGSRATLGDRDLLAA